MSNLSTDDENRVRGKRMVSIRIASRLTQAQFAEKLDLSIRAYQNYERGDREMPIAVLHSLYHVFKIDPLWMLIGPGDAPVKADRRSVGIELVKDIIVRVEKYLITHHRKLSPDKKAQLIGLIYECCADTGTADAQYVNKMVSLVA